MNQRSVMWAQPRPPINPGELAELAVHLEEAGFLGAAGLARRAAAEPDRAVALEAPQDLDTTQERGR